MGIGECYTLEFPGNRLWSQFTYKMSLRVCFLEQSYEGGREEDQAERGVELHYHCNTNPNWVHKEVGVWVGYFSYVSRCCGENALQKHLKERRVYFDSVWLTGKWGWWEHDVAGHVASAVRRQRDECWCSVAFSFLFSSETHPVQGDSFLFT